jgi:hypothetical protein
LVPRQRPLRKFTVTRMGASGGCGDTIKACDSPRRQSQPARKYRSSRSL